MMTPFIRVVSRDRLVYFVTCAQQCRSANCMVLTAASPGVTTGTMPCRLTSILLYKSPAGPHRDFQAWLQTVIWGMTDGPAFDCNCHVNS